MNDANAERGAEPSAQEGDTARAESGDRDAAAVIEALNAENGQLKDRVLRTLAEMENLRRRTEREVSDAKAYGVSSFARDMLTVVDNLSRRHTVVEVSGLDRPGLLRDLTATLSSLNLNIGSAHIVTFGEKAVDSFYISDLTGQKINAPARQAAIKRRLLADFGAN